MVTEYRYHVYLPIRGNSKLKWTQSPIEEERCVSIGIIGRAALKRIT